MKNDASAIFSHVQAVPAQFGLANPSPPAGVANLAGASEKVADGVNNGHWFLVIGKSQ